jgi:enterochelin esterase-like enzyme
LKAVLGCAALACGGNGVAADEGSFVVLDAFPSRHVAPRKVVVWLPPGYDKAAGRYPVIYMHDGQNLFDPNTAMGGQAWGVHKVLAALIASRAVRPAIVVGIWSNRDRAREYGPAAAVDALPPALRDILLGDPPTPGGMPALSDQYLRFLVGELKPAIDGRFRTERDRRNTYTIGSSMGALIALYAAVRYPEIFGGAGCLSTHWPVTTNFNLLYDPADMRPVHIAAAWFDWLATALPRAGMLRLYFDHGDVSLDALYAPYQQQMDAILRAKGYRQGVDVISKVFPGSGHSEADWGARVDLPLRFLIS